MKRVTLILVGLLCLPMAGSSRVWGEGDSEAAEQGRGERGPETRGTGLAIDWHSIDGGGVMFSTGGGMTLGGTLGQADAGGPMTGGALTLTGGFWVVAASSPPGCPSTCGDINGSGGNVNLIDFAHYLLCHNTNNPNPPDCDANEFACSDLTGNGAVNFLDFATFALYFNASTTKTPPNCAGGPP